VALGRIALVNNTTGSDNTAVGTNALYADTVGINNTAVGRNALYCNTASNNTAVGFCALRNNTTGDNNTALGFCALASNTTANSLVAVGYSALAANTTGISNVAVGRAALVANTTGERNIGMGRGALFAVTTGNRNIAMGHLAQCAITTVDDTIAIGHIAQTSATSGHTVWGTASNNVCNCVYAAWSNVSDCRDKTNIKALPDNLGLQFIKKLKPISYHWDHRDTYVDKCGFEYGTKDGTLASEKEHYGIIAQDLKAVLDELGARFDSLGHDDEKDAYRVTYEELIAPIIKAIQEQQAQIEALQADVETLKNK
jgi:hypothetical protein